MTDCADLEAFALTEGEAAMHLQEAMGIVDVLEAACINEKADAAPLPRGMLSCGEASRLIPLLAILLIQKYPRLVEPEMFAQALQLVAIQYVDGEPN